MTGLLIRFSSRSCTSRGVESIESNRIGEKIVTVTCSNVLTTEIYIVYSSLDSIKSNPYFVVSRRFIAHTSLQEELDDFTLEHAIEVLTEQLDTSLEDYEAFIEEQVDRIETAIENLKFTVNPTPVVPDPSEPEEDEGEGDEGSNTDGEDSSDADDGRWKSYQDALRP